MISPVSQGENLNGVISVWALEFLKGIMNIRRDFSSAGSLENPDWPWNWARWVGENKKPFLQMTSVDTACEGLSGCLQNWYRIWSMVESLSWFSVSNQVTPEPVPWRQEGLFYMVHIKVFFTVSHNILLENSVWVGWEGSDGDWELAAEQSPEDHDHTVWLEDYN